MIRRLVIFVFALSLFAAPVGAASDNLPKGRGLSVSPVSHEIKIGAGKEQSGQMTVGNFSPNDITADISVKQFSVTDGDYDYRFRDPEYRWITFDTNRVDLRAGEQSTITYQLRVPPGAASGGYYFALTAKTEVNAPGSNTNVQVASLLYVSVDGSKASHKSTLDNVHIPLVVFDDQVPYSYDIRNDGNVHFNAHFTAQLKSAFGSSPEVAQDLVILPSTIRMIKGTLPVPPFPWLYQISYGYNSDTAGSDARTAYVLYVPPWSLAALIVLLLTITWIIQRRHARRSPDSDDQP